MVHFKLVDDHGKILNSASEFGVRIILDDDRIEVVHDSLNIYLGLIVRSNLDVNTVYVLARESHGSILSIFSGPVSLNESILAEGAGILTGVVHILTKNLSLALDLNFGVGGVPLALDLLLPLKVIRQLVDEEILELVGHLSELIRVGITHDLFNFGIDDFGQLHRICDQVVDI